jgi:hypothetical protein
LALWKLQRWTAIEATLKAWNSKDLMGAGFAGVHYLLRPLALRPGLVCTLALPVEKPVTMTAIDLAAPEFSAALERSLCLGSQG